MPPPLTAGQCEKLMRFRFWYYDSASRGCIIPMMEYRVALAVHLLDDDWMDLEARGYVRVVGIGSPSHTYLASLTQKGAAFVESQHGAEIVAAASDAGGLGGPAAPGR